MGKISLSNRFFKKQDVEESIQTAISSGSIPEVLLPRFPKKQVDQRRLKMLDDE